MSNPKSFEEFKAAVLEASGIGKSKGLLGHIFSGVAGVASGGLLRTRGLNEMAYDSFMESQFRARFEAHKGDPDYINTMIEEAISKLNERWS